MRPRDVLEDEGCRMLDLVDDEYRRGRVSLSFRRSYEEALTECLGLLLPLKQEQWVEAAAFYRERHVMMWGTDLHRKSGARQAYKDLQDYLQGTPVAAHADAGPVGLAGTLAETLAEHLRDYTDAMWEYGYLDRVHSAAASKTKQRDTRRAQQEIARSAMQACQAIYIHHQRTGDEAATLCWAAALEEWTARSTLE